MEHLLSGAILDVSSLGSWPSSTEEDRCASACSSIGSSPEQIDYRLVDNHLSTPSHLALNEAVFNLDPQTRQEEIAYRSLLHTCIDMTANRALIEATTGQSL